jgi:predicted ester cyclase
MPVESVMEHQRIWMEGLNRGDVSAADFAFAPDCVVHITGVAEPVRGVGPWKELMSGFLRAFPDLHFTIEDQVAQGDRVVDGTVRERWEQWDQPLMLQQLGFA